MKAFQIASIIALASVATAQLDNIPSCALNCFVGPLTSDGCSSLTDFACHCKQGATLLGKVKPCVEGACSAEDQAAASSAVETTCKDAGVPIVIPDAGSPTGTVSPVATSADGSPTDTVSPDATFAASSAASAVASAASSLADAVSSALATPTGNSTGGPMPTPSASASQFTGGAPQATGAAVLVGAAALAMFL